MKRILYFVMVMWVALLVSGCGIEINNGNGAIQSLKTPSVTLSSSLYFGTTYKLETYIDNARDYKEVHNDIYSYYISYQKKGTNSWGLEEKQLYIPITIYTNSIVGFKVGDQYKVRMRVKNKTGYSGYGYSDYVQVGAKNNDEPTTSKQVEKPVGIITTYYKSLKAVAISWDYKYGVDKYYISYKNETSSTWSNETSTTTFRNNISVKNLSGKYRFRVRAYIDEAYSGYVYSEYINIENISNIATPTSLDIKYYKNS